MKIYTVITFLFVFLVSTISAQSNWTEQQSNTSQSLRSVYFSDSKNGWAVGFNGTILNTTDGGENWAIQTSGTTNKLYSVIYFIDDNTGWVVGEFGTILHTTDGGNNWSSQTSGTIKLLNSVFFVNSSTGFIAGRDGTILKTTDAGSNWSVLTTGTTEDLNSVFFLDINSGFAVGYNGTILKTSDGGSSWSLITSGTLQELNSVYFVDSNIGWICGSSGTILKTSDSGSSWGTQSSGTSFDLTSLSFKTENIGWAAGLNGTVLFTMDSGVTWNSDNTTITNNLYSIFFNNLNTGWAVGDNGKIIIHTVKISFTPTSQTVSDNNPVTVDAEISGVMGLFAISVTVQFDGTIIECQNIYNGNFLESNLQGYDVVMKTFPLDLTSGDSVIVDQSILGISSASGSGKLFTLEFVPQMSGTSSIKVIDVSLRDLNNGEIKVLSDSAEINVISNVVNAKIFLEGPYNSGSQTTFLNSAGIIPQDQPYSGAPWNYNGTESVSGDFYTNNSNIVDWVLVSLRTGTAANTTAATRAAFLRNDGLVVDLDGSSPVSFFVSGGSQEYYVVITHRNHLAVMSSISMQINSNTALYNFTNSQSKAYGSNSMKDFGDGNFGLFAGDANGNGQVQNNDSENYWRQQNGQFGYKEGDFNMNSQVQNNDRETFWRPNNGKGTQVPN